MRTMLLRKQIINSGSCQRKKTETKKREIHVFNNAGMCRSVMGFSKHGRQADALQKNVFQRQRGRKLSVQENMPSLWPE